MATACQAAPPQVSVAPYSGLGRRTAAAVIDLVLIAALLLLVSVTTRFLRTVSGWSPAPNVSPQEEWLVMGVGSKLLVLLTFVIMGGPLYGIYFENSPWQATIGKRLLSVFVTDTRGERITLLQSFGRSLCRWLFGPLGLLMSVVTTAASKEKTALHDMIANTRVLRGRPAQQLSLEPWRVLVAFVFPFLWIVGTFLYTM